MKRLSDEAIIDLVTEYHFSGEQNRHILGRSVARAAEDEMLKWVVESMIEDTDNFKLPLSLGFIQALKQQVEGGK